VLSTDAVFGGDVTLVQVGHTSSVAAGASYTQPVNGVVMPASTAPGNYFLIVRTDVGISITESNETNNDLAVPIIVTRPDLVPTNLTAPATAAHGQAINVSWTITNQGIGPAAGGWADRLLLSSNSTFDSGDVTLVQVGHTGGLAAGSSYTQPVNGVVIPFGTLPGDYFLIIRTDFGGVIAELNETNNDLAVPITIT
jgi:large repetitive protein